jgi:branched-chain amino acid transport system ATP-binding protein
VSLLKLEQVSVSYGGVPALGGLSLEIAAGETVCLIGSNGVGKSTALKAILGLLPLAGGSISFGGRPLKGMRTEAIVALGLGVVPEGRRVFPGLSTLENLKVGSTLQPRHAVNARLEEIYQLFPRLKERRGQMGWSLSGGEQQMLSIGRGLMSRPKLLLLDEPSLGLAPLVTRDVFNAIAEIGRRGTAVLVLEQNAQIALGASQRGYVLENGRLVLEGQSSDLVHHPKVKAAFLGGD